MGAAVETKTTLKPKMSAKSSAPEGKVNNCGISQARGKNEENSGSTREGDLEAEMKISGKKILFIDLGPVYHCTSCLQF